MTEHQIESNREVLDVEAGSGGAAVSGAIAQMCGWSLGALRADPCAIAGIDGALP